MRIDLAKMAEAVGRVRGTAVMKKAQVESYTWFCLKNGKIYSFDGTSGTITNSGAPVALACCVPAKRFASIIATLRWVDTGEVVLEDGWLRIFAGKYQASLPTESVFDFPDLIPTEYRKICEAKNLSQALKLVASTMEKDQDQKYTYGCGIRGDYVYTTDGKRLTRAKLDSPCTEPVSVGYAAARQMAKMGPPDFLFRDDSCLGGLYTETKTLVVSRLLNNSFPFDAVDKCLTVPDQHEIPVTESLCVSVDRMKALAVDEERQLQLTCKDKRLTLSTVETDGGQSKDVIDFDAPDFKIKIKAASIHAALKTLKPDVVDLGDVLSGDARMLLFRGSGYRHAIALMH